MQQTGPWPNGAQCAVMFTFDFDAETLWISRDPSNWKRPGTLSQGTYGAKVGVPKILELLRDYRIEGNLLRARLDGGKIRDPHRSHAPRQSRDRPPRLSARMDRTRFSGAEREALEKGLEALKRTVGVRPSGYRSPAGETSENMVGLLAEYKFLYDSSLQDDINPYQLRLAGGASRPDRTALALEPGRRALHALFLEEPAPDHDQLARAGDLAGGVQGDLPLRRVIQSGVPPAGDRPAFPHSRCCASSSISR